MCRPVLELRLYPGFESISDPHHFSTILLNCLKLLNSLFRDSVHYGRVRDYGVCKDMKIKIFTTGGTIDKVYFDQKSDYQVGDPQAKGVLERANVVLAYTVESIIRKDSLDFTDKDRDLVLKKVSSAPENRIVITHGTDTMIQTAKVLEKVPGKTVVLTGSMYPAQFRDSDAVFNIGCAVTAVQILAPGVYLAMNGRIFNPGCARKNIERNRFEETD